MDWQGNERNDDSKDDAYDGDSAYELDSFECLWT